MSVSNDGPVHNDKYLNTSNEELSQEMFIWNIKALALIVEKLLTNWQFDRQDKNNLNPIFDSGGII